MICVSAGSKSRLGKAAGAEVASQSRQDKLHAAVARSFIYLFMRVLQWIICNSIQFFFPWHAFALRLHMRFKQFGIFTILHFCHSDVIHGQLPGGPGRDGRVSI